MFLYDTNIISELIRSKPNFGVEAFSKNIHFAYISAVTVEEIFYGLSAKTSPKTTQRIEELLRSEILVALPITSEIAKRSGELRGLLRIRGQTRAQADMLVAATALEHQLTVVTRNVKDFENCGIALLNPFQ